MIELAPWERRLPSRLSNPLHLLVGTLDPLAGGVLILFDGRSSGGKYAVVQSGSTPLVLNACGLVQSATTPFARATQAQPRPKQSTLSGCFRNLAEEAIRVDKERH